MADASVGQRGVETGDKAAGNSVRPGGTALDCAGVDFAGERGDGAGCGVHKAAVDKLALDAGVKARP